MKNFYLAAVMVMLPFAAVAETLATGDQITAAISGNTVQGRMMSSGAYTEFYAADGTIKGKKGATYNQYNGFCLESQHYPDSVNKKEFPSTILKPGEKFSSTTTYKFLAVAE